MNCNIKVINILLLIFYSNLFAQNVHFITNKIDNEIIRENLIISGITDNVIGIEQKRNKEYLFFFENEIGFEEDSDGRIWKKIERGILLENGNKIYIGEREEFLINTKGECNAYDSNYDYLFTIGYQKSSNSSMGYGQKQIRRYRMGENGLRFEKSLFLPDEEHHAVRIKGNHIIVQDYSSEWGGSYFKFYDANFNLLNTYLPFDGEVFSHMKLICNDSFVFVFSNRQTKNKLGKFSLEGVEQEEINFSYEKNRVIHDIKVNQTLICIYSMDYSLLNSNNKFLLEVYNTNDMKLWEKKLSEHVIGIYMAKKDNSPIIVVTQTKIFAFEAIQGELLSTVNHKNIYSNYSCLNENIIDKITIKSKYFELFNNNFLGLLLYQPMGIVPHQPEAGYLGKTALFVIDDSLKVLSYIDVDVLFQGDTFIEFDGDLFLNKNENIIRYEYVQNIRK